jgi:hypothetical protein
MNHEAWLGPLFSVVLLIVPVVVLRVSAVCQHVVICDG